METVLFEVVTPENVAFSSLVIGVVLRGQEGEFGVLPGHAPMIARVLPGAVQVTEHNGSTRTLQCGGGTVEVLPLKVTLITPSLTT